MSPTEPEPAAISAIVTPRFDLRSSAGARWSRRATGGGLAVGPDLERLLREEFRHVASSGDDVIADPAGNARLRSAIAAWLRATRGARCETAQVVILSGAVLGATAIGRLWLGPGRRAAVEDPGDPTVRRALLANGGKAVSVPVDGGGWHADQLPSGVDVAVTAPTVHVPTGATQPLARRLRTLAWASTNDVLIVEDARFDDHLLRSAPLPCLQGLDHDGRVIHLGSFETLLHAGVRTAFAIVPSDLVESFVAELATIGAGASPVQQRALARFIADGLMDRHLGHIRRSLLDRQEVLLAALQRDLGWLVSVRPAAGGTRLVATIEDPSWTAHEVAAVAARAGVALETVAPARLAPAPDRELVIDFGRHGPLELQAAVRLLAKALHADLHSASRPPTLLTTLRAGA